MNSLNTIKSFITDFSGDFTVFNPASDTGEFVVRVLGYGGSHPFQIADYLMEKLSSRLAYVIHHKRDVNICGSNMVKPVQTASMSDSDNQLGVVLKTPLNFDYDKVKSAEVLVRTSSGDHLLLTGTEKNLNSKDFVGRLIMEEKEIDDDDDRIQVRPGDVITVSYGWVVFQRSVFMNVIR